MAVQLEHSISLLSTLILSLTVGTLISVFFIKRRKLTSSQLPLPPGPFNWPVVGSLFRLGSNPHRSMEPLVRQYGPIIHMMLGSRSTLVVSSAEMAQKILLKHDAEFSSRPPLIVGEHFSFDHNALAFSPETKQVKNLRKLIMQEILGAIRFRTFVGVREAEIGSIVNFAWSTDCSCSKTVEVRSLLKPALTNIMSRTVFGKPIFDSTFKATPEMEGLLDLFDQVIDAIGQYHIADLLPFLRRLDLQGSEKKAIQLGRQQRQMMRTLLEKHKLEQAADTSNQQQCALDLLLALEGENQVSERAVMAMTWELLIAGTDTTATSTEWALALLLRYPHVMTKAHEELDSVVGKARRVKESDLPNLVYIQAVVKESLRLRPVTTFGIPHYNEREAVVAGFRIPAKTQVYINQWGIMRDPAVWDSPVEFRPERFLKQDITPYGRDFRYLPFTSGRRGCPGAVLGMTAVTLSLASLLHAFHWTLPDGQLPEDMNLDEETRMTSSMKVPLVAVAAPRIPSNMYNQDSLV